MSVSSARVPQTSATSQALPRSRASLAVRGAEKGVVPWYRFVDLESAAFWGPFCLGSMDELIEFLWGWRVVELPTIWFECLGFQIKKATLQKTHRISHRNILPVAQSNRPCRASLGPHAFLYRKKLLSLPSRTIQTPTIFDEHVLFWSRGFPVWRKSKITTSSS